MMLQSPAPQAVQLHGFFQAWALQSQTPGTPRTLAPFCKPCPGWPGGSPPHPVNVSAHTEVTFSPALFAPRAPPVTRTLFPALSSDLRAQRATRGHETVGEGSIRGTDSGTWGMIVAQKIYFPGMGRGRHSAEARR